MIHARPDYARIQDPAEHDHSLLGEGSTPIAANEPVVLFRAQDKHMGDVLLAYREMVLADDSDWHERAKIIHSIDVHLGRVADWQRRHGAKTPDIPGPSVINDKSERRRND